MLELLMVNNAVKDSPIFDGTWVSLEPDANFRYGASMALYGGSLFVFSGRDESVTPTNTIRRYDIASNTWYPVSATLPRQTYGTTANRVGNKIYVYGGANSASKYGDMIAFDPGTNTILTYGGGVSCEGHTSATHNTDIYVYGGTTALGSDAPALNTLRRFDTVTNTWTKLTGLVRSPTARTYACSGIINGKLYIVGGTNAGVTVNTIDIYDIATNTWLAPIALPYSRTSGEAVVLDNILYLIGGRVNGEYSSNMDGFNPVNSSFTTATEVPDARSYACAATDGTSIYLFGGYNASLTPRISNVLYQYAS